MKAIIIAVALALMSVPAEACVFTDLAKVAVKTVKVAVRVPESVVKGTVDGVVIGTVVGVVSTVARIKARDEN